MTPTPTMRKPLASSFFSFPWLVCNLSIFSSFNELVYQLEVVMLVDRTFLRYVWQQFDSGGDPQDKKTSQPLHTSSSQPCNRKPPLLCNLNARHGPPSAHPIPHQLSHPRLQAPLPRVALPLRCLLLHLGCDCPGSLPGSPLHIPVCLPPQALPPQPPWNHLAVTSPTCGALLLPLSELWP